MNDPTHHPLELLEDGEVGAAVGAGSGGAAGRTRMVGSARRRALVAFVAIAAGGLAPDAEARLVVDHEILRGANRSRHEISATCWGRSKGRAHAEVSASQSPRMSSG